MKCPHSINVLENSEARILLIGEVANEFGVEVTDTPYDPEKSD
ncbi:hypothetical protein [Paenibacillus amylolyticus]|nr:hypothetical protein [Paenibacillus amylolyticus]